MKTKSFWRLACAGVLVLTVSISALGSQVPTKKKDAPDSQNEDKHATRCKGKHFHIGTGASEHCCQTKNEEFHVKPDGTLAHRQYGRVCSEADGISTNCTGTACSFGPCGARIVPTQSVGNTFVFIPHSDPKVCGYQTTTTAQGDVIFVPERYVDQQLYPAVTPTCLYTKCLGGGRRGVALTVTATADAAKGHVKSDPPGIDLTGSGTASATFEDGVELTAEPQGSNARAVFSGSCTKTGEYGKKTKCNVKLAPDPTVTVTYECRANTTCQGA